LQFKDMNAREWLTASGMFADIATDMNNYHEYRPIMREALNNPVTASLSAPLTRRQFAYALGSGSLPKHELYRLTDSERQSYEQRLKEARGPSPYFDR